MTTPVGLESTSKFTMTGGYFMQLYTEPLLLHNGGILHNSWPQIKFNHTIHEKPHNLWRTAQFSQNKAKYTQWKKKETWSTLISHFWDDLPLETHTLFEFLL